MIVISSALALGSPDLIVNPLNTPIFGWRSVVTVGNVAATSEADGFAAVNVANPATHLRWRADEPGSPVTDEYLTVTINTVDDIDYLAVAVHNFGSGQIATSVQGATMLEGSPPELNWFELITPIMLTNDDPVIFRFEPQTLSHIRLRMQPGNATPYAAVLYVGKLLVAPRGTHQEHVPINLARQTDTAIGVSESGNFLGKLIIGESRSSSFSLRMLTAAWYRAYLDPFLIAAKSDPFFFAWKPQDFPRDVGYCVITNDPQPQRAFDTKTMAVDLAMQGVATS